MPTIWREDEAVHPFAYTQCGIVRPRYGSQLPLKLWPVPVTEMMAGATLDVWSSQRMNTLVARGLVRENNSLFRDSRGYYVRARALPITYGTYGGVALGEYLLLRKFPKLAKPFSILNFGTSGIGL